MTCPRVTSTIAAASSALFWLTMTTGPAAAETTYYVELPFGVSLNGADLIQAEATNLPGGATEVDYETGFTTGLALGAQLGSRWRAEAEYLYRTDELGFAAFPDGTRFETGDFSSVALSANAYYDFPDLVRDSEQQLRPYLGAGVAWIQEVDIDFLESGREISFETDDFGYQLMAGLRWRLSERWATDLEYRILTATDVEMTSATGRVRSDYEPVALGLSVIYTF